MKLPLNTNSFSNLIKSALATALAASLVACPKKAETPATPAADAGKELVVGTDAAYAPFESEQADKTITGFDIDVVNAIAAKAGLKVKFVNTPWEGIFTQLQNGDRDLLVSAITITDERKATMDFSEPYFEAKQIIAVPKNSKVAKVDDLKPIKVGVQNATTGDEAVQKILGKTSNQIKRFESIPLALKELEAGGVDAVVADNGVVNHYVANNAVGFKTIEDASFKPEFYGIAVKKGNKALVEKINEGLKAIKADGTYQNIYNKYFGAK